MKKEILTFAKAEKMIRKALKGTAYESADLVEWGGGDGEEDIKPFLIDRKGEVEFGATVYPEGGYLFWVWDNEGEEDKYEEYEDPNEAITAFKAI